MMKRILAVIIIILTALPSVRPIIQPGYFPMHDDTQVARVVVMADAIKNGQFPVRWVDGLGYGYGYPLFNFYAPLPYYFGGMINALGIEAVTATKFMFLAGFLIAPFSVYFLLQKRFGKALAVLAAVLYTYAPYHAVQVYVRGAVGELWAYAFLPLLFLFVPSFRNRGKDDGFKAVFLSGLGFAAVILSHTIYGYLTGGIMTAVAIFLFLLSLKNRKLKPHLLDLIKVAATGLTVTAFFWLPALAEKQYTRVEGFLWDKTNYADHFVCLLQLWNSLWGYGGSAPGCLDGMSFMAGKLHLILSAVTIAVFLFGKSRKSDQAKLMIWLVFALGLTVFFMTSASGVFWDVVPLAEYVQYPWRLLPVLALATALIPMVALSTIRKKIVVKILIAAILVAVTVYYPKWFKPQIVYLNTSELSSRRDILFRASRVSDEYLPPDFKTPSKEADVAVQAIIASAGDQVEYSVVKETYIKAEVTASKHESSFLFLRAAFPGWRYLVNGREAEFKIRDSVPEIKVASGTNIVEMIFADTPVRRISNIISMLSVVGLLYLYGKKTNG